MRGRAAIITQNVRLAELIRAELEICGCQTEVSSGVSKLTDVRLVNNSLKTMLNNAKKEYYTMVIMVLANIPILYLINKDWYDALMHTTLGKAVLAICALVIFITSIRLGKITKPVEYRR